MKKQIKCSVPGNLKWQLHRSFTLLELLVVITIIGILMTILLPVLKQARESGKRVLCCNNLKQGGLIHLSYVQDNNGWAVPCYASSMPAGYRCWTERLYNNDYLPVPVVGKPTILVCPSYSTATDGVGSIGVWTNSSNTYGLNYSWYGRSLRITTNPVQVTDNYGTGCNDPPEKLPLVADSRHDTVSRQWYRFVEGGRGMASGYKVNCPHGGMCGILFADGHAKSFTGSQMMSNYRFIPDDFIY